MNDLSFSRRQALGALSAGVASVALSPARAFAQSPASEARVVALLDSVADCVIEWRIS